MKILKYIGGVIGLSIFLLFLYVTIEMLIKSNLSDSKISLAASIILTAITFIYELLINRRQRCLVRYLIIDFTSSISHK